MYKEYKYNIVYVTINKLNGHFYIGKHSTNDIDDGYLGSGKRLINSIKKYGQQNFERHILCFCDSEDDAYIVEKFLVTDYLVKRQDCYNMHVGGRGGRMNEETCKRHSEKMKEYYKTHDVWNKGKKNCFSEEMLKKRSEACKGKPSYIRTEEHRQKMREIQKGKKHVFSEDGRKRHLEAVRKKKNRQNK